MTIGKNQILVKKMKVEITSLRQHTIGVKIAKIIIIKIMNSNAITRTQRLPITSVAPRLSKPTQTLMIGSIQSLEH